MVLGFGFAADEPVWAEEVLPAIRDVYGPSDGLQKLIEQIERSLERAAERRLRDLMDGL